MSVHNKIPVFDGHNDSLMVFFLPDHKKKRSFFKQSDIGHIDLPRAFKGGLAAGFFAIFIPAKNENSIAPKPGEFPMPGDQTLNKIDSVYAAKTAQHAIDCLKQLEAASNGKFIRVKTIEDIKKSKNVLCAITHFEGAEPIDKSLENLSSFYDQGLRSVGIVWSRENAFGHGVNFSFPGSPDSGPGLTAAGKRLVKRCNALGIMVDVSHLTEKGFWDVAKTSDAPLVATHSCVHNICPMPRNLTDKQIDAIGETNGMIGINFCTAFLREDGKHSKNTPLTDIIRHIQYIIERIGVQHVGFGSDFDGAAIPDAIGDVAGLQILIEEMRKAGFNESCIYKIAYGNWLRVLEATWKNGK